MVRKLTGFFFVIFWFLKHFCSQMLAVRKNLTEILLEVTNEEIIDIVKESVAKNRKKGSECAFIVYKIIKTNKSTIRVFFYIKIGFPLHLLIIFSPP